MAQPGIQRELAFTINDVARLLRTHADQRARDFGMTRTPSAVPSGIEHAGGLNQSAFADTPDLQPITLTRLIDRLCENGLIERRRRRYSAGLTLPSWSGFRCSCSP